MFFPILVPPQNKRENCVSQPLGVQVAAGRILDAWGVWWDRDAILGVSYVNIGLPSDNRYFVRRISGLFEGF